MPLTVRIGAKLAQYEITQHLGSGGMGDVYQATDSTLGRNVAVKFLPDSFAHDAERVARFEREARVLASLNHPNIAAIYGLEISADKKFLVMELVPGETLADVIKRGAISVEESRHIAKQICDALELAHESGVVHRDLKPANIKVTPDGRVKVLDFGLATMVQPGSSSSYNVQNSPTLTQTLGTQAGMILGTAGYMSPEQAAGKILDKRTDIWSFGAVLFEMLTGAPLFEGGETVSHVLADVLRAPIDFSKLPAATPDALRHLLERCLDRDLKNRLRDIGEARIALDQTRESSGNSPVVPKTTRVGMWPLAAVTLAAVIAAGIAGGGWWRATRPAQRPPLMRFEDNTGQEIETAISFGPSIAISQDGQRVVLVTRDTNGRRRLSIRSLGSPKPSVVSGTEGLEPASPFFSPDGLWIAFFSDNKLKKISVEGGAAITLCDVGGTGSARGGFWGEDDNILFASQRSPLMRVSSSGGMPAPITKLGKDEVTHRFPQLLPGSEAMLFSVSSDNNIWNATGTIAAQILKTGERKTLLKGGYFGRYVAGVNGKGYLLYLLDGIIFAAPMDLKNLEVTGTGVPVLDDVSGLRNNGFSQWTVSQSGTLAYVPGSGRNDQFTMNFMDLSGKIEPLPAPTAAYQAPVRPSPDGTRLLVRLSEGTSTNLAVFDLSTRRTTRLTFIKGSLGNSGTWTPDGKHIVFGYTGTELNGPGQYWIRADGGGEPQRVTDRYGLPWSFSPDGKRFIYYTGSATGNDEFGLWTVSLSLDDPEHPKGEAPELFLKASATVQYPTFSPDGHWLAYSSIETGKLQVYVRPFVPGAPASGGKWQISNSLGTVGFWLPNHELLFSSQSSSGIVSYTTNPDSFVAGPIRPIFEKLIAPPPGLPVMMPDGKRFIVVMPEASSSAQQTHVRFLLNFADELERRASAGTSK